MALNMNLNLQFLNKVYRYKLQMEGRLKVYECEDCSYSTRYEHYLERHTRTHLIKVNKSNNQLHESLKNTSAVGKHYPIKITSPALEQQNSGNVKIAQETTMLAEYKTCVSSVDSTTDSDSDKTGNDEVGKEPIKKIRLDLKNKELAGLQFQDGVYHCHLCPYKSTQARTVKIHIKVKHLGEALYSCTECDIQFFARRPFIRHNVRFHPSRVKKRPHPVKKEHAEIFSCPDCSYTTCIGRKAVFQRHRLIHAVSKTELCTCHVCLIDFKTQHGMKTHYGAVHRRGAPLSCDLCSYTTNYPKDIEIHIRRHTKDFKLFCDKCGKGFASQKELKSHGLFSKCAGPAHVIKMHNCSYCNYSTSVKEVLMDHEYEHGHGLKEPPYKCELTDCDFTSFYRRRLQDHERKKHGIFVKPQIQ